MPGLAILAAVLTFGTSAARAAPFVNDTFTGSAGNLTAHTGETGATWAGNSPGNTGTTQLTGSGAIRETTLGIGVYYASGTPSDANQKITSTFTTGSNWAGSTWAYAGLGCRVSTASYSGYYGRYYKSNTIAGRWEIAKYVSQTAGSTGTILASSNATLSASTSYPVEFDCLGTSLVLKNASTGATLVSTTDSGITAANKVGLQLDVSRSAPCSPCNQATDGFQLPDFAASNVTAPNTAITTATVNSGATTIATDGSTSTTATDASFSGFTSDAGDIVDRYECRIDGAAYATCTDPKTYSSLTVASHTFDVRGCNAVGCDATPATRTWTVTSGVSCPVGSSVVPTTYATISAAYTATSSGGTICVNGGTYSMANFTLGKTITLMGINTPSITQTSTSGNLFSVTSTGVTIKGLTLTGQNRSWNNNDCNGGTRVQLINVTANGADINHNFLWSACGGITFDGVSSGSATYNEVNNMDYWGIDLNSVRGASGAPIVVDHNTVNDMRTDGSLGDNAYGIVASGGSTLSTVSNYVDITNNTVDQAPTWECIDSHSGTNINILSNTCINAGRQPIVLSNGNGPTPSGRVEGNTVDANNLTTIWDAIIHQGANAAPNTMLNNTVTHYPGTGENGACFYAPSFSGNASRFSGNSCTS